MKSMIAIFSVLLSLGAFAQQELDPPRALRGGGSNAGNHGGGWRATFTGARTFAMYLLQTTKPTWLATGTSTEVSNRYLNLRQDMIKDLVMMENNFDLSDQPNANGECGQTGTTPESKITFAKDECENHSDLKAAMVWLIEIGHHFGLDDVKASEVAWAVAKGYEQNAAMYPIEALEGEYQMSIDTWGGTCTFSIWNFDLLSGCGFSYFEDTDNIRIERVGGKRRLVLKTIVKKMTYGGMGSDSAVGSRVIEFQDENLNGNAVSANIQEPRFISYNAIRYDTPKPWVELSGSRIVGSGVLFKKATTKQSIRLTQFLGTLDAAEFKKFFADPTFKDSRHKAIESFIERKLAADSNFDFAKFFDELQLSDLILTTALKKLADTFRSKERPDIKNYLIERVKSRNVGNAKPSYIGSSLLMNLIFHDRDSTMDAITKMGQELEFCEKTADRSLFWNLVMYSLKAQDISRLIQTYDLAACRKAESMSSNFGMVHFLYQHYVDNQKPQEFIDVLKALEPLNIDLNDGGEGQGTYGSFLTAFMIYNQANFDRSVFDYLFTKIDAKDAFSKKNKLGQTALDYLAFAMVGFREQCKTLDLSQNPEDRAKYERRQKFFEDFSDYIQNVLNVDWKRTGKIYYRDGYCFNFGSETRVGAKFVFDGSNAIIF